MNPKQVITALKKLQESLEADPDEKGPPLTPEGLFSVQARKVLRRHNSTLADELDDMIEAHQNSQEAYDEFSHRMDVVQQLAEGHIATDRADEPDTLAGTEIPEGVPEDLE